MLPISYNAKPSKSTLCLFFICLFVHACLHVWLLLFLVNVTVGDVVVVCFHVCLCVCLFKWVTFALLDIINLPSLHLKSPGCHIYISCCVPRQEI